MRIRWASFFLFLALSPSLLGISEALEHWEHLYGGVCQEEGIHVHSQEHHCSLDSGWMWVSDGQVFLPHYMGINAFASTRFSDPIAKVCEKLFEWKKGRAPHLWTDRLS